MDSQDGRPGTSPDTRTEAQRRIDEAFHRDKLGLPLTGDQVRIVQFLSNGFGCHSCPPPARHQH